MTPSQPRDETADRSGSPQDSGGSQPLVSIVTPTFNSAAYLRLTLESVASQTYRHIEHIVVDGGSTDQTLALVREFPGIRCITGRDTGMYDAINKGLRAASGSILAYLNSDDLYFPDSVERAVDYFRRHPSVDLVFGNCQYIDDSGQRLFIRKYPRYNWRLYSVLDGSTIPQQSTFWRRGIMERAGYFDDRFRMAGDFEFFIRAGKQCTVGRIGGAALAQFRFHPGMLTLNRKAANDAEIERIHALHPAGPRWALPVLRLVATGRYRSVNAHRVIDKIRDRVSGKKITYHP